jgi:cell wall-associated NlpC family hydrolase
MKRRLRVLIVILAVVVVAAPVRATEEQDESFAEKVKDFFTRTPTPAPSRKKRKTTRPGKKAAPSPSPGARATPKPSASPSETPEPSATPRPTPTPLTTPRPSPSGTTKPIPTPSITPPPGETPTPTPSSSLAAKKTSPAETTPPSAVAKKGAPNATVTTAEIVGYDNYSPEVRKIIEAGLALTSQNLGYKYGSADPANGGMDCSGFIHYVLAKSGYGDVPRDAREQYIWVRKSGNFKAVLGHSDDTFELDELRPGDLLFWSGTYITDRDPDITHTMIYLGREKATNHRIMVGASDGRTYKGQSRFGVSVFDFKVSRLAPRSNDKPGPVFVGYGRIPGLHEG